MAVRSFLRRAAWIVPAVVLTAAAACGDEPEPADQPQAADEQVFVQNCSVCHGTQAEGTAQGPPLVHEIYEPSHHSDDSFRSAVADGVVPHHWEFGPMPAIPSMSEQDVEAAIAYVRGLQRDADIE